MNIHQRICEYLSHKHVPFTYVHAVDTAPIPDWSAELDWPAERIWTDPPLVDVALLFVDRQLAMLVKRAGESVDPRVLSRAFGARKAALADLRLLEKAFPGVDVTCLPPFGELWQMPVFVDETLAYEPAIRFCAGSHNDILTIRSADFERLNQPVSVPVATLAGRRTPLARDGARQTVAS